MSEASDRLGAIRDEFQAVLEERITDLLGQVKAVQQLTRHIASIEVDMQRQEAMRGELEAELDPLNSKFEALKEENGEIQVRVESLKGKVESMRRMRAELVSNLSGLTSDLKGLTGQ